MTDHRVLVTDHNIRPEGLELLKEHGAELTVLQAYSSPKTVLKAAADVDAILARVSRITADIVKTSPNLKIVSRHGVGYDNVDVDACTRLGIAVTISGDANSEAVSEYAFTNLLAVARKLTKANAEVKSGLWNRDGIVGVEFHRKTLGIIGLGRIGSRLTKHAGGFDMDVLVFDPYADPGVVSELGAERVDLKNLLQRADFISLHTPLTDETRHLIGKPELDLMKPSAILVNTARGGLVDEEALYDALTHHTIAGAALDVFEQEPLPGNHPLTRLDNLICSPHVAGQTAESLVSMSVAAAQNILSVFRGDLPDVLINPDVLQNTARIPWKILLPKDKTGG